MEGMEQKKEEGRIVKEWEGIEARRGGEKRKGKNGKQERKREREEEVREEERTSPTLYFTVSPRSDGVGVMQVTRSCSR